MQELASVSRKKQRPVLGTASAHVQQEGSTGLGVKGETEVKVAESGARRKRKRAYSWVTKQTGYKGQVWTAFSRLPAHP